MLGKKYFYLLFLSVVLVLIAFQPTAVLAATYTGLQPSALSESPQAVWIEPTNLPASVDLRGKLPPVGDQGTAQTCTAWTVGYYLKSYQEALDRSWSPLELAHQFSPSYLFNQRPTTDCQRDNGMTYANAFRLLQKGAAPLSQFPYTPNDLCTRPSEQIISGAYQYQIVSYAAISGAGKSLDQIKGYLAKKTTGCLGFPCF